MKVALITYHPRETAVTQLNEDFELLRFLQAKNLKITHVIWNDPKVNWEDFKIVILKSPWDYHDQPDLFCAWLEMLASKKIRVLNPADLVKWNSDKHYLQEINKDGFPVISSLFLEKNSVPDFDMLFNYFDGSAIVVKPCISASAKNTMVVTPENLHTHRVVIDTLLNTQSLIVQPFMNEIKQGEWSLLFFNGKYSHSVLKIPNQGDFKVQNGTIQASPASLEMISTAGSLVSRYAAGSLYARVDGILSAGAFKLMELELIEPFLFLETDREAFENYYTALCEVLEGSYPIKNVGSQII